MCVLRVVSRPTIGTRRANILRQAKQPGESLSGKYGVEDYENKDVEDMQDMGRMMGWNLFNGPQTPVRKISLRNNVA